MSGSKSLPSVCILYNDKKEIITLPGYIPEKTENTNIKTPTSRHQANVYKDWPAVEDEEMECPVCFLDLPIKCYPNLVTCSHKTCTTCLRQYITDKINASRVQIECPHCQVLLHPADIKEIVQDNNVMEKYECFTLRTALALDTRTRWCPTVNCTFAVLAEDCAACPKITCQAAGCNTEYCYLCSAAWHENKTCAQAMLDNVDEDGVFKSLQRPSSRKVQKCPKCSTHTQKIDGCNDISCPICGTHFCWLCGQEVTPDHFLTTTGCTYYGNNIWTRRKKILINSAIFLGAPAVIVLAAGVAIPAVTFGLPAYVIVRLYRKCKKDGLSRLKRTLLAAAGGLMGLLTAPLVAGLVVWVGVPVLLLYTYCYLPLANMGVDFIGHLLDEEEEDVRIATTEAETNRMLLLQQVGILSEPEKQPVKKQSDSMEDTAESSRFLSDFESIEIPSEPISSKKLKEKVVRSEPANRADRGNKTKIKKNKTTPSLQEWIGEKLTSSPRKTTPISNKGADMAASTSKEWIDVHTKHFTDDHCVAETQTILSVSSE